jgi:carboxypeptidase family protein
MAERILRANVVALAIVVFVGSFAAAQTGSGIAGVVKDATGGVLPGVAVEASSPSLLEKARTVVTDGEGLYNITDLRPGIYTVTFTLSGFNTIRREGVELTSTFTATVNVDMRVGTLEETIRVSGATPVVDLQNVVQQKVITRDVLDVLPVGSKSWAAVAVLVPGVRVTGAQNVGGTGASNVAATIHGGRPEETVMLLDGMRYHQGSGTGGIRNAYNENDASVEEISFETGALSAESEVGGFVRNIIPKEGGNTFKGFFAAAYTNHSLESDNLDDALRNRGVPSVNFVDKIWDLNPAIGGPIRRNKLWFYAAFRSWGVDQGLAATYFNSTPRGLSYTPDLTRPALSTSTKGSENLRLTWMATPKNKVGLYYEYQQNWENYSYGQGSLGGAGTTSPESISKYKVEPNYWVQARWTNPVTSRLLLEAGTTFANNNWVMSPQPENPRDLPAIRELRTSTVWRNLPGTVGQNATHQYNFSGSLSYVTGSHTFKTGALVLRSTSHTTRDATGNATTLQFLDAVPSSVVVYATPLTIDEKLGAQVGIFAQDQWKVKRLALSMGLRFDYYNASVPEQRLTQGPWVPTRDITFPEVPNVPNWKDLSPRFGVAYDLFGTGKTALKATISQYLFGPELITFTRLANPVGAIASNATRTWGDANGDFIPQLIELGALSASTFGTPNITTRYDPELLNGFGKRGYNWEFSTTIQHELIPRVGVSAAYFRRWWGNLPVTQNQAVTASDFSPYCIAAPLDSRLPGGGGNQLCGLYDVSLAKFGQTNNVITFVDKFGKESQVYDGVDLSINARLPNGIVVAGGTNTERTRDNICYAASDPSLNAFPAGTPRTEAYCDIRPPFLTQYKLYGAYPLPWWGIETSATFQSVAGPQILASYTARNNEIAPTLGRPLSSGTNGTVPVQLIAPGTVFGDRLNQIDFRLSKTFKITRGPRVLAAFDLYNLFNGNPVIAQNNTFGPAWQRPTVIQLGRLAKFGLQLNF